MKYVCLVYGEERRIQTMSADESKALDRDSLAYNRQLQRSGHLIMAHPLAPTSSTRTVRVRENKTVRLDGPFAETKEQLLGFVIVEASGKEEASNIAAGIPIAKFGTIEVRELTEIMEP